ncbi:MAG: CDP-diacylglycerol--glycerol-3-phosphate 3-phosphatidyltransferase [Proteobacteria bacterium]|nr:CDP-diacylglycerol--glycerol-3-phosphate 3-phosphatidyltransferase [Pseudomonadota bacterium]
MAGAYLNLPNWITMGRLLAVPVLFVLMLFMDDSAFDDRSNRLLSLVSGIFFTVAMSSDMLDGYLARRRGLSSTFGKFFDPLADKLLFLVAIIMLIPLGRMPAWLVAIFLVREVTVTALRGIAIDEGIVIAASHWGKYKAVFVAVACTGLLLHYPFLGIQWRLIGWVFMVPAVLMSLGSGIHYAAGFLAGLKCRGAAA